MVSILYPILHVGAGEVDQFKEIPTRAPLVAYGGDGENDRGIEGFANSEYGIGRTEDVLLQKVLASAVPGESKPLVEKALNRKVKLLLEVGAEGGSLAIYGTLGPTGRKQYRFGLVDDSLLMLDEEEGAQTIRQDSGWLDSWDAAIKAFSVYPWPRLYPTFVAPEVSLAVWNTLQRCAAEASGRGGEIDWTRWQSVIRKSVGVGPDHMLASIIVECLADTTFAASWQDEADTTFRPYAVAVLELRDAGQMSAEGRHALIQELCRRKRVAFLSDVLGTRIPGRVLQWSGHAAWEEFSPGDWHLFFRTALAQERHSAITGVRTINRTLLKQLLFIPEALRRKGLLTIVSQLEIPADRWVSLAANFAMVDSGMRPAMLRQAGTMEYRGEFWDLYFRCEGKYWQPFRLPATLPSSDLLEPLLSPLDMDAEGLLMKNCLSTLPSRVFSGDRIYFRMRDKTPVNAELIGEPNGWVPGHILGPQNAPIPEDIAARVRNELSRMGHAITEGARDSSETDAYLEMLRQEAREIFGKGDIDAVTRHLASIQGQSLSWTRGAYVIFGMPSGGFVQFMCSPDAEEYLCEIQSYKYTMSAGEYLDAAAVDLNENAGFVWPMNTANFIRWFKGHSPTDIEQLAAFALAVLHRLFHCRSVDEFDVKSHIPDRTKKD